MRRLGVSAARERLFWDQIEPRPDGWDWQTRHYEETRARYTQDGVGVLEMCIGTPAWLARDKAGIFPRDLIATAKSWAAIGEHWQSHWQGLEIWNEPDIGSGGNQPADQYLPTLKAVRYGLRSRQIDVPIVGGAFAYFNRNYLDLAARNGLLDESDALSFHYYGEPDDLQERVADYRAWLRGHGSRGMPLWITEIGPPWEGTPGKRADAPADAARGLKFARNAAEARACGVARIFPFVMVDYSEQGSRVFGMLDAAGSPLRVMGDYAESIRELSGCRYLGDLTFAPGSRVFRRDAATAVVVFTAREVPPSWPFPCLEMHGIDGRVLAAPDPADGLTYLTVTLRDVEPFLRRDTPAAVLCAEAAATPARRAASSPVILLPVVEDATAASTPRGYQLAEGAATVRLRVRAFNLGASNAVLKLVLAAAPRQDNDNGHGTLLATQELTVAAGATGETGLEISTGRLTPDPSGACQVTVNAGGGISPVAVDLILSRGLQEQLAAYPYRFALPIAELRRWKDNSAGHGAFSDPQGGGWAYDAVFSGGDRWAFPRFTPPQEVDPDRVTAVLVRARCTAPGTVRVMAWDARGKSACTAFPVIRPDGAWHVALVPLDSFLKPGKDGKIGRQIHEISLGVNSDANTNRIEVSDFYLLGGR